MKTVKFFTLGCKVNQYETQAIREDFSSKGFTEVNSSEKADVYVINSCTVTARADHKSRDLTKKALNENANAKVVVTGCFIEDSRNYHLGEERLIVVKNSLKHRIAEIIDNDSAKEIEFEPYKFTRLNISDFQGHNRAFIKIQDGCDNSCAYCKIPLVRGKSRSRDQSSIYEEVKRLLNKGFKEIVLTGICLGAYRGDLQDRLSFEDLIEHIISLKGEFRVRLSSIEARDISDRIVDLIKTSPRLCRHLHIPFQSGDDDILRKMNRNYTSADYISLAEKLRAKIQKIAITADIMVGFPSEDDEKFNSTYTFLEKVKPCRLHIFPFSPRPGTAAFSLGDRASSAIVKSRIKKLLDLAKKLSFEYRKKFLNEQVQILIESERSKINNYFHGYTDTYIDVLVNAAEANVNKVINAKIVEVTPDFTIAKQL